MNVILEENQYGKCNAQDQLIYPGVDSCLTVTALFGDGYRTGAHLTEVDAEGGRSWKDIFRQWIVETRGKQAKPKHQGIVNVFVLGDLPWPDEAMRDIRAGIAELGVNATDARLREEARYGDIGVGSTGIITGRTERVASAG